MDCIGLLRDRSVEAVCALAGLVVKSRSQWLRQNGAISRILIVKPGSVGDVLMATPTVRALRKRFPSSHLAFAVGSWSRAMVDGNPRLDTIVDLGQLGGRTYRLGEFRRALRLLRHGHYDGAVVLDRSPMIGLLVLLSGIAVRIGLDSAGRGFAHNVRVPCRTGENETGLYLRVALACGCQHEKARMEFFPSCVNGKHKQEHGASSSEASGASLVAIHPGGGINPMMTLLAKRWPAERFAAIADRLVDQLGVRIVLVGGQEDIEVVQMVRAMMRQPATDLAGKLSWEQLAILLRDCRLMVANDTGAAHLAMATGTNTVMVFGPSDPAVYGPAMPDLGEAVSLGLPCSPCFTRGRLHRCRDDGRCMKDLHEDLVWEAVVRQWNSTDNRLSAAPGTQNE